MSLYSYIEKVRERQPHEKQRFAFLWAFSLTAIIGLFWLGSFEFAGSAVKGSVSTVADQVSSPGQALVAGVADFAGDVWSLITGPRKIVISEVEVLPAR